MRTPICDFCARYAEGETERLHMPGHKGVALTGMEQWDLTEIEGADSLYEADGIIRESEANASILFGCPTFYTTEGSSHAIRAMLYLLCKSSRQKGVRPVILAGRNVHKTFVTAAALLDIEVVWLTAEGGSYLSCPITPERVEAALSACCPIAVYLTSPDYLGHMVDMAGVAAVCHRHGVYLAVDSAHGAYLHFLPQPMHPIDQGADIVCSSAHKTLPALTGCAYLHVANGFADGGAVKEALAMFGSTSPSYLLLQSLDRVNRYIAEGYPAKLAQYSKAVAACRAKLACGGYECIGDEETKLTLCPRRYGYTGIEVAMHLRLHGMECEFADPDHIVMMLTPENGVTVLERLASVLLELPKKPPLVTPIWDYTRPEQILTPREAMLSPSEEIKVQDSPGRIAAALTVGCPPAVPIVICGEKIPQAAAAMMLYYGVDRVKVVR